MKRKGFTLIELLVVVGILCVLIGMLMAGIQRAKEQARRVIARTEVKQLEAALTGYLQEYQSWPVSAGYDERDPYPVSASLANILQGDSSGGFNSKRLQLMQFNKLENGKPVNPWGGDYYCKFDSNFDNMINKGRGATDPPQPDPVRRPVIIWTQTKDGKFIKSWNEKTTLTDA